MENLIRGSLLVLFVIALTGCGDSNVSAVKRAITEISGHGRSYETGPLQGGTAVLVDDLGAYWVSTRGKVYAGNSE